MTAAVRFDRVGFSYPNQTRRVLDDVSFELAEGTFALLTGATGSGKSTVLRAMNGLVPHFSGGTFSGRVLLQRRSTLEFAPRDLADVAAFVPQDPSAAFVVDRVEDELAYVLENLGMSPGTMRRRVEEALDLLDIERLRDRSVRTLSGGERQRVAIAAALTPGARVLLLDEPTSQLDPQGAEDVLAALKRLVDDHGVTVVAAEHRLERVAGFADVALGCLGDGRVVAGKPADVFDVLDSGPPVARLGRLAGWNPVPLTVREARPFAAGLRALPPSARSSPANGKGALLTARGVGAGYGDRAVLRNIDFSLRAGEIVAVIGRNGAGKTTLLRCLAGVHPVTRGEVVTPSGRPRPGHEVALCPQAPESILFKDTVRAEVEATLEAHGGGAADEVLDAVGLVGSEARHPRDLSAGERLLVAVAATVATKAPVLLLDEPTRGLDESSKKRLARFAKAFAAAGNAVAFASQDVELVALVADRVVMLAGGDLVAEGTPRSVLGDSSVFSPQVARVLGADWLTVDDVRRALEAK